MFSHSQNSYQPLRLDGVENRDCIGVLVERPRGVRNDNALSCQQLAMHTLITQPRAEDRNAIDAADWGSDSAEEVDTHQICIIKNSAFDEIC